MLEKKSKMWTGCICLRMETCGSLLWTR